MAFKLCLSDKYFFDERNGLTRFVLVIVCVISVFLVVSANIKSISDLFSSRSTVNKSNEQRTSDDDAITNRALTTRSQQGFEAYLYQRFYVELKSNVNDEPSKLPVYNSPTTKRKPELSSSEAHASLTLAREMLSRGKLERAVKILEHALALDPRHPDILNEYGEFMEHKQADVVEAERLYGRAIISSPSHTGALANYRRTAPTVNQIDHAHLLRIDRKRDSLMHVPDSNPGMRRLVEENYYRHLYHATALEGNTFSLAQTRSFVDSRIVVAGKSIIEHNEILGMEAALAFLNSSLINRIGAITIQDILDIQHRVLGFVDPFGAGVFRKTQVYVSDFIPPEPSQVEILVAEFVDWLNSNEALQLHPIEMAALAHYKLVYIHPFYDGNGRTSRLLMNLVLMQAGYPPTIIPVEHRTEYYEHLKTANDGDIRPFVRFIARCTERTIDEYLWVSAENANRAFPEISGLDVEPMRTIQLPSDSVINVL